MPTVQVNLASESRKATFLARLETLARVERTFAMAEGFVTDRTRKVADRVRGAVTGWMLAVIKLLIARVGELVKEYLVWALACCYKDEVMVYLDMRGVALVV